MRVTSNHFSNALVNQLNQLTARQYQLQNQVASGKRVQSPEDDPVAMQRTLGMLNEISAVGQYGKNISILQDRATNSFSALQAVKKTSDRAGEIATLAGGGTRSPQELQAYAREVTQMIQQAAQTLNVKFGDQYLFSGTQTDQPPFAVATDTDGNVTSVTYQGNANVPQSEIAAGTTLSVDVPGENTTGSGPRGLVSDTRSGADFFNHLIALQNHLLAGDTASIATDQSNLRLDEENLIYQVSNNGAVQTRLDTAAAAASARSLSLEQMVSKETDTDVTSTLVQLSQAQTAYQAALQSGATIMRTSLLDFLQ